MRLVLRNEKDIEEIGENIRLAREAQGMSQDDLADIVGTSRKAISRYENGYSEMGIATFIQYADALKKRPEQLLPTRMCEWAEQTQADELKDIAETLSEDDFNMLLMMAKHLKNRKK